MLFRTYHPSSGRLAIPGAEIRSQIALALKPVTESSGFVDWLVEVKTAGYSEGSG
jgi:hypothetical protein